MNITEVILRMYPCWILGIAMAIATLRSKENKDLMRIQPKSLVSFIKFMAVTVIIRTVMMYLNPPTIESAGPILQIPLAMTATVGWEDMCHTLPLAIAGRWLGDGKLGKAAYYALMALVMVSFSLGHLYQGKLVAIAISLYIPYVTSLGKKHGFGTVVLSHMLYDFITLLTVRLFLGV
jgi:hypothetical protein